MSMHNARDSALTADDFDHARKHGYGLEQTRLLSERLRAFVAETDEKLDLYLAVEAKIDPDELGADGAERFLADRERLLDLLGNESSGLLEDAVVLSHDYLLAGIVSDKADWFEHGIAPGAAACFHRHRMRPADAQAWLTSGLIPDEALDLAERGLTPPTAIRNRRRAVWTSYFARSSIRPDAYVVRRAANVKRVHAVLGSLAVPHHLWVRMYSPRVETWAFLDGGAVWLLKYGFFGRPSGTWVMGTATLRLICHRLGHEQPRRLRNERAIPDADQLEQTFLEDRRANWASLSARLGELTRS